MKTLTENVEGAVRNVLLDSLRNKYEVDGKVLHAWSVSKVQPYDECCTAVRAETFSFYSSQGLDLNKLTLSDRLKIVISAETKSSRRYADLENVSGIPADHWKSFWHGKQRPTAEMVEAVCKNWSIYAFWIATGSCESKVERLARYLATLPDAHIDALAVILGIKLEG